MSTETTLVPAAPAETALATSTKKVLMDFPDEKRALGWAAGATMGALMFSNHPVLGFFAGSVVGYEVPGLLNKESRMRSISSIAIVGGATTGSLLIKKHPVAGFALGGLLATVASAAIPGSWLNEKYAAAKKA